jgi:hypothetical protein
MAMNKRRIKSNEASKKQPEGRYLSEELANLHLKTVEYIRGGNFNINATIHYLNSYIKLLTKYISEKDIENALKVQVLLDHAFYNFGLGKPLYLKWAARKGGLADKRKKGILLAIKEALPRIKEMSATMAWRFFEREHSPEEILEVGGYEIYSYNDLLFQEDPLGKLSSIKFKTFEKYFYQVLRENPQIRS